MIYSLVHHGLITVPIGSGEPGIYWLRLYVGASDHIAVVTEVPGNGSFSVMNGTEQIVSFVAAQHDLSPEALTLFEVWPSGSFQAGTLVHRVLAGPELAWIESSRSEIEALIGAALPELPSHQDLWAQVAARRHVMDEQWRPVFEAVAVADLPPPHGPFKCQHRDRFDQLRRQTQVGAESWHEADLAAGRRFLATLTPADLQACRYHRADWKAIADESVRIIESLGRRDREEYDAEAKRSTLPGEDRRWLVTLFAEPIFIGGGAYINGQHRGCALRFSGADRAAVVTGDESLGEELPDWIYEGNG
ncbi:MAG: hypothetical protein ABSE70_10410 [Candidatus Limnocylindrales bacterium]